MDPHTRFQNFEQKKKRSQHDFYTLLSGIANAVEEEPEAINSGTYKRNGVQVDSWQVQRFNMKG